MTEESLAGPVTLPPATATAVRTTVLALAVLVGTAVALLAAVPLLAPTATELRLLGLYVLGSSAVATAIGWAVLQLLDRLVAPSLAVRAFAGTLAGGVAGLLNILLVARLMFINTSHDLRLLIVLLFSATAVSLFFAVAVASMTGRRLEAITGAIRRLAGGDFAPAPLSERAGGREVERLAEDVERLRTRLRAAELERRALEEQRRELGAAISHDLRTPLASMRAVIEALDDGVVEDPEDVRAYYGHLRREAQRLARMVDDLFELAQIDAGALPLDLSPVALAEVLAEVVEAMRPIAQQRGVTLRIGTSEALPPQLLDAARLERAIANLVRNAIEHSPAGSEVAMSIRRDGASAVLSVRDNGEGITAEALPHVWERFYRAEPSRARRTGLGDGAGLGLAIVQSIVEAHGGRVAARSTPGQGATFEIWLPLAGTGR